MRKQTHAIPIGGMIRQGDVLFMRVKRLPERSRLRGHDGRCVVELGEATGHAHVLEGTGFEFYDVVSVAETIVGQALRVLEPTPLSHEEHATQIFPRDTIWERWYQVESDGSEERIVRD